MTGEHDPALLQALLDYALALPTAYDPTVALDELASTAAKIVPGSGCGVMAQASDGSLRAAAGSDRRAEQLEHLQVTLGEGPCLLAFETGEPVWSPDLEQDPRFPRFGPQAAKVGLQAVLSIPMLLDGHRIGAYNLYNDVPQEFDEDVVLATRVLAALATGYLLAARGMERQLELGQQLQAALDSRILIEQAKGRLSATLDITPDEAFALLRRHARSRSTKMAAVASDVVERRLTAADLAP